MIPGQSNNEINSDRVQFIIIRNDQALSITDGIVLECVYTNDFIDILIYRIIMGFIHVLFCYGPEGIIVGDSDTLKIFAGRFDGVVLGAGTKGAHGDGTSYDQTYRHHKKKKILMHFSPAAQSVIADSSLTSHIFNPVIMPHIVSHKYHRTFLNQKANKCCELVFCIDVLYRTYFRKSIGF